MNEVGHLPRRKNWIDNGGAIAQRFVRPAVNFMHVESASGSVLLVAAIIAVLWANLSWFGHSYEEFWHSHIEFSAGPIHFDESLKHVVNDGLMAVFFFVVGLEIKRELVHGELREPRKALLPIMAAAGGMVVPALIFVAINGGTPEALSGWGIPMATDIAFSVGILALVGSRVPIGAKLFLLALAVVDDLGAIAVIAVFYTDHVQFAWLVGGVAALGVIAVLSRIRIRTYSLYVPLAIVAWFAFLESGVHATIAGVMIGFLTPASPLYDNREFDHMSRTILDRFPGRDEPTAALADHEALLVADVARESVSPLSRAVRGLHGWTSFGVIPIFALANAGVRFGGLDIGEAVRSTVALGIAAGLVFGKTLGVLLFTWVAVRVGWGELPTGMNWRHVTGVAMLAGVGFTVALFIADLAYVDEALISLSKIGIFMGSIVAGVGGYLFLRTGKEAAARPASTAEEQAVTDARPRPSIRVASTPI